MLSDTTPVPCRPTPSTLYPRASLSLPAFSLVLSLARSLSLSLSLAFPAEGWGAAKDPARTFHFTLFYKYFTKIMYHIICQLKISSVLICQLTTLLILLRTGEDGVRGVPPACFGNLFSLFISLSLSLALSSCGARLASHPPAAQMATGRFLRSTPVRPWRHYFVFDAIGAGAESNCLGTDHLDPWDHPPRPTL